MIIISTLETALQAQLYLNHRVKYTYHMVLAFPQPTSSLRDTDGSVILAENIMLKFVKLCQYDVILQKQILWDTIIWHCFQGH